MNNALLKLRETGPWHLLKARYEEQVPECKQPPKGTPLGMEKIFTLFVFVCLGGCIGLVFLAMEMLMGPQIRPASEISKPNKRLNPIFLSTALDYTTHLKIIGKSVDQKSEVWLKLQALHEALKETG